MTWAFYSKYKPKINLSVHFGSSRPQSLKFTDNMEGELTSTFKLRLPIEEQYTVVYFHGGN